MSTANKLKERYPELYTDVLCGVTIGEGWLDIVCGLSDFIRQSGRRISIKQVKEKFGTFCIIYETTDGRGRAKDIDAAVQEAEYASIVTCEDCGKPGQLERTGPIGMYLRTLCKRCFKKSEKANGR